MGGTTGSGSPICPTCGDLRELVPRRLGGLMYYRCEKWECQREAERGLRERSAKAKRRPLGKEEKQRRLRGHNDMDLDRPAPFVATGERKVVTVCGKKVELERRVNESGYEAWVQVEV